MASSVLCGIHLLKTWIHNFPFVVLNFCNPDTENNKLKRYSELWKPPLLSWLCIKKKKGRWNAQIFGSVRSLVLICLLNRSLCVPTAEEKSRWSAVRTSASDLRVFFFFLFSRAKTEGDRRVASNLRAVVVFTLCFQLVVLVLVCVVWFECFFTTLSLPNRPPVESADWELKSWAEVRSPPHRRRRRSSSHHA